RLELLDHAGPEDTGGAQLRNFHEEIHADGKKETETRREIIDLEAARHRRAGIFQTVGKGEGELLHLRRAGFLHVIAGDGGGVEARHLGGGVANDIANNPHAGGRRIDIGVADHELLQNVVLNGPGELVGCDPLLFGGDDIVRHDRQYRAVHRHGNRHLVERNTVKEDFHILDAVDGDARLPDVADNTRMIRIIAAVGSKIKGDRKTLLASGKVAPVKSVRFLGGRETGILANRPRAVGIHGGAYAALERRNARQIVRKIEIRDVGRGIKRLDRDSFGRFPVQLVNLAATQLLLCQLFPILQSLLRKFAHSSLPPFYSSAALLLQIGATARPDRFKCNIARELYHKISQKPNER